MSQHKVEPKTDPLHKEVITIRPPTTTRDPIRITIMQRATDKGEIAMATANLSGLIPDYFEKPDLLEDIGKAFFVAAYFMRRYNKNVKNGK